METIKIKVDSDDELNMYRAIIWRDIDGRTVIKATFFARSLREARQMLIAEYGDDVKCSLFDPEESKIIR